MKLLLNYRKMVIIIMSIMLLIVGFTNESIAQKLQLVIGKYDCTTNGDCSPDQFCDIDAHRCIRYTDKAECPTSPGDDTTGNCSVCLTPEKCIGSGLCPEQEDCPICSDCTDKISPEECPVKTINCALGQYNFNNKCVECVHNDNCPSDRPLCRDNQCVSCGAEHWNNYACVTCSGAKPKWDASSLTCVECLSNNDCDHVCDQSTKTCHLCMYMDIEKPYYNAKTNSCEVCPKEKPIWYVKEKECKKCFTNIECEKFDISTPRCASDGKCYACESGTYWNTTLKNCVECLYEDHCSGKTATPHCLVSKGTCINCSGTTPIWNGSACTKCVSNDQCAAINSATPACNKSTGACAAGVTITWNNMGTKTQELVVKGSQIQKPANPVFSTFGFSHWATSVDGSAVTFPYTANANTTFYAYHKAPATIEEPRKTSTGGQTYNYSYDSYNGFVAYKFTMDGQCFHGPWGKPSDPCKTNTGEGFYCYSIDGAEEVCTVGCSVYAGIGTRIKTRHKDKSRNGDADCNYGFTAEPFIKYPY